MGPPGPPPFEGGGAPVTVGRPFPHTIEAERALLGGLLQVPEQIPTVGEVVSAEDFYRPDHQELFRLLLSMQSSDESIDLVTVPERILREGRAQHYGGVAYVVELPEHVPSTTNLEHYARLVREKSMLRQVIVAGNKMADRAYADPEDLEALLADATREVLTLGNQRARRTWQQISLIVDNEIVRIEQLSERKSEVTGLSTGFLELNKKLAGLQKTDLVILAARPAMGKTALALNIAQNVAMMEGVAIGLFSLEMSRGQLVTRLLCCQGEVDAGHVRTGKLSAEEFESLVDASEQLRQQRIFIDDTPGLSITDVRGKAKRLKSQHEDLSLIVIDYLQLMRGDDPRASREQQISAISRGLKALAKDLDVAVVALSQLNRGVESRADKRPMVSDLRESGAIEQDADVILFIYRDEYYNPDSEDKGLAEVIIAKQRNGPTGMVKLVFQGQYTRFDNLYKEQDEFVL